MQQRPLSPHLQVYKFFPQMFLSIFHRITGVGLTVGLFVFTWWLASAAAGETRYDRAVAVLSSWPVQVLLAAWLFAWVYHFVNGIRHLLWDATLVIEKAQVRRSRTVVVAVTLVAWLLLAWLLFRGQGVQP